MTRLVLAALALALTPFGAIAATIDGNGALALAALVAERSSSLSVHDKRLMVRMLNGDLGFSAPAGRTIAVVADAVVCKAGDVDISAHACELSFGAAKRMLVGRAAHELYATLAEIGAPPDGAAGTIYEAVTQLRCTIDPSAVKQRAGAGAECTFMRGPP
jgi:hypothetical protein